METGLWRLAYKVVTKNFRGQPAGAETRGRKWKITRALIPARDIIHWAYISFGPKRNVDGPPPPFTIMKRNKTAKRLPAGKAPGTDGIFNEVLKVAIKADPDNLLEVYSTCLRGSVFTEVWKMVGLALIYKGSRKTMTAPNSFHPLCMLATRQSYWRGSSWGGYPGR